MKTPFVPILIIVGPVLALVPVLGESPVEVTPCSDSNQCNEPGLVEFCDTLLIPGGGGVCSPCDGICSGNSKELQEKCKEKCVERYIDVYENVNVVGKDKGVPNGETDSKLGIVKTDGNQDDSDKNAPENSKKEESDAAQGGSLGGGPATVIYVGVGAALLLGAVGAGIWVKKRGPTNKYHQGRTDPEALELDELNPSAPSPDTAQELNGLAHSARNITAYAPGLAPGEVDGRAPVDTSAHAPAHAHAPGSTLIIEDGDCISPTKHQYQTSVSDQPFDMIHNHR